MRRPERFEAQHGSGSSFDEAVILFHNIVEIFTLANLDALVFIDVELFQVAVAE